jgi:Domain of unknown function (DUF4365)
MEHSQSKTTDNLGLARLNTYCAKHKPQLSWRETPKDDIGIDGEIELYGKKGKPYAKLIKVQLKSTLKDSSYIKNELVKNDSVVTNSTVEQLGFSASKTVNTSSTPNTPTDLVGKGTSDGINSLKWSRNGNRQGVMFIIEAKIGDSANYVMVDAVTGSRFEHVDQIPGVKIQYRVKAKRSNAESGFSNVAIVYP